MAAACCVDMKRLPEALDTEVIPACRQRLAAAFEGHGQQGCPERPSFSMESLAPGASPTLIMRCSGCACVHVIV